MVFFTMQFYPGSVTKLHKRRSQREKLTLRRRANTCLQSTTTTMFLLHNNCTGARPTEVTSASLAMSRGRNLSVFDDQRTEHNGSRNVRGRASKTVHAFMILSQTCIYSVPFSFSFPCLFHSQMRVTTQDQHPADASRLEIIVSGLKSKSFHTFKASHIRVLFIFCYDSALILYLFSSIDCAR